MSARLSILLPLRPRLATGRTGHFRFLVASRFHRPPVGEHADLGKEGSRKGA